MEKYIFEYPFEVRDYECDMQGIVNNAVYLNYLEHTRHRFLLQAGCDFASLHPQGIDPVVKRMEIDYKQSLRSGDKFVSKLPPRLMKIATPTPHSAYNRAGESMLHA